MDVKERTTALRAKIVAMKRWQLTAGLSVGILLILWGLSAIIFSEKDIGTKQAAEELQKLSENVRRYYQNRPDFWGLNTQAVLEKDIAPRAMKQNGKLQNFYGKKVLVGNGIEGTMLMPGARNFDITYRNLNKQECAEIAAFRFAEKFWLGVSSVTVSDGSRNEVFSWNDQDNILPIAKEKAKKICRSEGNLVLWHFE